MACAGFFLPHHAGKYASHLQTLIKMHNAGELVVTIDQAKFEGIESVPAAVQHLQSGHSSGKVVVLLNKSHQARL